MFPQSGCLERIRNLIKHLLGCLGFAWGRPEFPGWVPWLALPGGNAEAGWGPALGITGALMPDVPGSSRGQRFLWVPGELQRLVLWIFF